MNPQPSNEAMTQMFQAFAAVPTLVSLLEDQAKQISAMRADLRVLQNNQHPVSELPEGYIDPKILAAVKYVTIKQAAFLLNRSEKSVRREIQTRIAAYKQGTTQKANPCQSY